VNNAIMLADALSADPNNAILEAMLTDELLDARDMLRSEADRHIAALRAAARTEQDFHRAAELLADGSPRQEELMIRVYQFIGWGALHDNTLFLVPGLAEPLLRMHEVRDGRNVWAGQTVTVGATWLLAQIGSDSR
jgi:hypothetical protein